MNSTIKYLVTVSGYPIGFFRRRKSAREHAQEESKKDSTPRVIYNVRGTAFRCGVKVRNAVKANSVRLESGHIQYSWEYLPVEMKQQESKKNSLEEKFYAWMESQMPNAKTNTSTATSSNEGPSGTAT